jgi:hypothetical protein
MLFNCFLYPECQDLLNYFCNFPEGPVTQKRIVFCRFKRNRYNLQYRVYHLTYHECQQSV